MGCPNGKKQAFWTLLPWISPWRVCKAEKRCCRTMTSTMCLNTSGRAATLMCRTRPLSRHRPITSPTSTTTWSPMPSMTRGSKTCRPSSASSAPALLWSGIWSIIERWARQQESLKPRRKSGLPSCRTWTWCIYWSHTPTTNCSAWSKHRSSISATPGCAPISPAG